MPLKRSFTTRLLEKQRPCTALKTGIMFLKMAANAMLWEA
jgi:hypothetical protein